MPKCYLCDKNVPSADAVKAYGYNFHKHCAELYQDKRELQDYICILFGYKKPGPRILQQIKKYVEEDGYTYREIKLTLQYFFEVRKNSIKKANGGIGIVPYVYEEAGNYYGGLRQIINKMSKEVSYKECFIDYQKIQERDKRKIDLIDMSSII